MIDILMATYNGEKYINEQIESIIKQTYTEWKLYIRDDGSSDRTIDIIESYQAKYPDKIIIIRDSKKGLGAKLNFAELLKYSKSEYCMFSDQDDVWLEKKIEVTLKTMKDIEQKYGKSKPILVHTDLKVTDKDLNIINNSFWKYQKLDRNYNTINYLLVQNNITGCTMMLNKSLVKISNNIPKECVMHDWWIGLIGSVFGKVIGIDTQTMLYRQHGNNEVGAHKYGGLEFVLNKFKNIKRVKMNIDEAIAQSRVFYNIYKDKLTYEDKKIISEFSKIKNKNIIKRKSTILKYKLYKQGIIRSISYIILI